MRRVLTPPRLSSFSFWTVEVVLILWTIDNFKELYDHKNKTNSKYKSCKTIIWYKFVDTSNGSIFCQEINEGVALVKIRFTTYEII